jgi:hypothetical protein
MKPVQPVCGRCGGSRSKRLPAMPPGDPFQYGPGPGMVPLCGHRFHGVQSCR